MNDSDGATTKRQPAYSNHKHNSAAQAERSASKELAERSVIGDSSKQQKITVKMSVSRETSAKST